jgi:glycine cleavage system protein P-like pyridoxal-binding family
MVVSEIQLYEALAENLGKEKAKALTEYIEAKVEKKVSDEKTSIVSEIEAKISESKAEMIKWMFIFWVGTIGVLSAIIFAMLNAYLRH